MPCGLNSRSSHGIFLSTRTKTKSSCRTLPLIPACEQMLKKMQKEQALNRKVCGKDYCTDYLDYIYVNPMGRRIRPNFLSQHFLGEHKGMICNKNKAARNLKKVRTACLVPVVGVEPTRVISTRDFESPSSAIPTHRRIVLNDFYYTGFYG